MNCDFNERDLKLIKVALDRISPDITDKEYYQNLKEKINHLVSEGVING